MENKLQNQNTLRIVYRMYAKITDREKNIPGRGFIRARSGRIFAYKRAECVGSAIPGAQFPGSEFEYVA